MSRIAFTNRGSVPRLLFGLAALSVLAFGQARAEPPGGAKTWEQAWPRLIEAEDQSKREIDNAIKVIDRRFDEASSHVQAYSEEIMGLFGKLSVFAGGAEDVINGAAGLIDGALGTKLGQVAPADRFGVFARERFTSLVLDPLAFKREIQGVAATYGKRLQAIETRLLMDLEVDAENGWDPRKDLPAVSFDKPLLAHIDGVCSETVTDASRDLIVEVGKQVGGGYLTSILFGAGAAGGMAALTDQDPVTAATIGLGFLAAMAVDYVLEKAVEAVGHQPVKQLTDKVKARLDTTRSLLIDGSQDTAKQYRELTFYRFGHPDSLIRTMCARAMDALDEKAGVGLRSRLLSLHWQRSFARRAMLYAACHPGTAIPDSLHLRMETIPSRADILAEVSKVLKLYGGNN
jgi:hypothetical protein